jgi:hypothetical protein
VEVQSEAVEVSGLEIAESHTVIDEKQDPDPYQSEKSDPDQHKVKKRIWIRVMPICNNQKAKHQQYDSDRKQQPGTNSNRNIIVPAFAQWSPQSS